MKYLLVVVGLLFSLTSSVEALDHNPCKRNLTSCALNTFKEISKIYRPSGGEVEVHNYIKQKVEWANRSIWRGRLSYSEDKAGNLVVRVPARGWGNHWKTPVALQAHTDMVIAAVDDRSLDDLKKYGVDLEEKDGFLQSRGQRTTLGADDGFGVAMQMNYILSRHLHHPPLELIFTVEEEVGLRGASQFEIPIRSKTLINLESNPKGYLVIGSQGALRGLVKGSYESNSESPEGGVAVEVSVSNLRGGHSGDNITDPRLNGIVLFSMLMEHLDHNLSLKPQLQSVLSGERNAQGVPTGLNKISNQFSAVIYFPDWESGDSSTLVANIRSYLEETIQAYADEDLNEIAMNVNSVSIDRPTLSGEETSRLVSALRQTPNGVLESDPSNPLFPDGLVASSNLGFFELALENGRFFFEAAHMARSFLPEALDKYSEQIRVSLMTATNDSEYSIIQGYAPWFTPADSPLVKKALKINSHLYSDVILLKGGLEPGVFLANKRYCPQLKEAITFGPLIEDAHSVKERVELASIPKAMKALHRLLNH